MSSFNNINKISESINRAFQAHAKVRDSIADICDGGRKWRKAAIKNGVNRYSDPDYIEACRTDARRTIAIWSKY